MTDGIQDGKPGEIQPLEKEFQSNEKHFQRLSRLKKFGSLT
jgi:hypothetical protein